MGTSHGKFVQLHEEGKLLAPDTVGRIIALMAISGDKLHEWSGKFIQWDDPEIAKML